MKLKLDFHGTIFEFEKKPMQEGRFRVLCALAAAAMYVTLTIAVTRFCGILGLLVIAVATIVVLGADSI